MAATKHLAFISSPIDPAVQTNIDGDTPATRDYGRDDKSREMWQELIDRKLIEWGCNPSQFDDEGVEPPSREIIRLAIRLAQQFRDDGLTPPDSVVPDANGGIVFELRENDVSEVYHVWDDGTVEYQYFQGTRLLVRRAL
jgi:hypothetical protein